MSHLGTLWDNGSIGAIGALRMNGSIQSAGGTSHVRVSPSIRWRLRVTGLSVYPARSWCCGFHFQVSARYFSPGLSVVSAPLPCLGSI